VRGKNASQTAILISLVALLFSIAANVGTGIQAHRNCKGIELLKSRAREVTKEQYDSLLRGEQDKVLERVYGADWPDEKRRLIEEAERRYNRFAPMHCSWFDVRSQDASAAYIVGS